MLGGAKCCLGVNAGVRMPTMSTSGRYRRMAVTVSGWPSTRATISMPASTAEQATHPSRQEVVARDHGTSTAEGSTREGSRSDGTTVDALPGSRPTFVAAPDRA